MVYPGRYGDSKPRLSIYWTNDTYKHGFFDLDCLGFVSVTRHTSPGAHMQAVSVYGGTQSEILVNLELQVMQNKGLVWALFIDKWLIGYWPASLFGPLHQGAGVVDIGD
jgi:hypothetical protein